jgi:putative transposase
LARLVVPGLPHHLVQRGNNRGAIFARPSDRRVYLALLRRGAARHGCAIWAYCLMTNHVHLLAVPGSEPALARTILAAHMRYAQWFNRRHGTTGHLWGGRYHSAPLDPAHLVAAVRYIELNPVRAGLVERPEEYLWSSARAHGLGESDPLLAPSRPFPGVVPNWLEWLSRERDPGSDRRLRAQTRTGRPCGSDAFVTALEVASGRRLAPQRRHRGKGDEKGTADCTTAL